MRESPSAFTGSRPTLAAAGTARILRYQNTDVAIEADAPGGGFVVLNDIWHRWWRATVDDKTAGPSSAQTMTVFIPWELTP